MLTLVAEDRAVDALLWLTGSLIDAVIDEVAPNKEGVARCGVQCEFVAGADAQF